MLFSEAFGLANYRWVSEVVPGAAAEKAKFVSSLVYCELVLVDVD